jgi:Cu+-exporting ATPase
LGLLIRGPEALEQSRTIDTVILDKTGTLTTGNMTVLQVIPASGIDAPRAIAIAAAVEQGSEHPLARSTKEKGEAIQVSPR